MNEQGASLKELMDRLSPFEKYGKYVAESGNTVFGDLQSGPKNGWVMIVFPPITNDDVKRTMLQSEVEHRYPYFENLNVFNGLNGYSGQFVLYGSHIGTEAFKGPGLPFNIIYEQSSFRKILRAHPGLLIGSTKIDRVACSLVQKDSGEIVAVNQKDKSKMNNWVDLEELVDWSVDTFSDWVAFQARGFA